MRPGVLSTSVGLVSTSAQFFVLPIVFLALERPPRLSIARYDLRPIEPLRSQPASTKRRFPSFDWQALISGNLIPPPRHHLRRGFDDTLAY